MSADPGLTRLTRLEDLPELLTVDEAAKFLKTSRNVVYDAVRTGQLPSRRFAGRLIRIPSRVLTEFVEKALRERETAGVR